jgi:hypothetical protein
MNSKQRLSRPTEPADQSGDELVPLHQRPEYVEPLEELQELERLHSQKEAEQKRLMALARGEKTKRTAAERAKDLLAGGRVDPVSIPDRLAALNEELLILRQAITAKTRALDEIAGSLSYAESEKLKPEFDRIMREALAGMERLHGTFAAAAQLASRLHRAGYRPSPILLSDLAPPAAALLGDPAAVGVSQAWYFKRALEQRGII